MQTVKLLIKYNVDVNVADNVSIDIKLSWPLPSAAMFSFKHFLEHFLQEGWTALHVAVQSRNRDIVKVLLVNGADKNRRNKVTLITVHLLWHHSWETNIVDAAYSGWNDTPGSLLVLWQGLQVV